MTETISITELTKRSGRSRQDIHYLIKKGADGPFPGARQANSNPKAPYQIPIKEANAWIKSLGEKSILEKWVASGDGEALRAIPRKTALEAQAKAKVRGR